ncbi:MAG: hypothetical protein GYB67_10265 [Chloroflexi bacterium]|nr:hypothetical protein [Chloroflexota bacterium]
MSRKLRCLRFYLAAAGVLLLAFGLRVHTLGVKAISGDEAFGWMMIQQPFFDVLRPQQDLHPPLYHAAEWWLARLVGDTPFGLRFAALIFGVLAVAVTIAIGWRLIPTRRTFGLIAGGLLAVSPINIYWSQDARLYTLLVLTTAMSTWAFIRLSVRLSQPPRADHRRWGAWLAYFITTLAAMYTQYGAFWVIGAQNVVVLLSVTLPGWTIWRGRRALVWFAGQILLALIYLPWVLAQIGFLASPQNVRAEGFTPSFAGMIAVAETILASWVSGAAAGGPLTALAIAAGLILAVIGGAWIWRRSRWQAALIALWAGLTLLVIVLFSQLIDYFEPRFAIAGTVAFVLLAAAGIMALLKWRWIGGLVGAALLAPLLIAGAAASVGWYQQPPTAKSDYGDMLAQITERTQPGDMILFSNPGQIALMTYYAPPTPHTLLDVGAVNSPGTADYLAEVVGPAARVWLVEFGDPIGFDALRLVPNWLTARGFRTWAFDYAGGQVALYDLRAAAQAAEWQPLDARFGDAIRLAAYRLAREGDLVRLSLRWHALETPEVNYHVGNYILDADGVLVAQNDGVPRGGAAPTTAWQPGDVIEDNYAITLPPDLAAGRYTVAVALYTFPELIRAPVSGADTRTPEDALVATFSYP